MEAENMMSATEDALRQEEEDNTRLREEKDALCKLIRHIISPGARDMRIDLTNLNRMTAADIDRLVESSQ